MTLNQVGNTDIVVFVFLSRVVGVWRRIEHGSILFGNLVDDVTRVSEINQLPDNP